MSRHLWLGMLFFVNAFLILLFLSAPEVGVLGTVAPRPLNLWLESSNRVERAELSALIVLCGALAALLARGWLIVVEVGRPKWLNFLASTSVGEILSLVSREWLKAYSWPSRVCIAVIGRASGIARGLDTYTSRRFVERAEKLIGKSGENWSTSSAYWYALMWVRRHDTASIPPLDNWLRLYSFARNLSCALYLAFLYSVVWLHQSDAVKSGYALSAFAVGFPLLVQVSSFAMLHRYYYLYADYFTKYLVRAYANPDLQSEESR